MGRTIRLRIIRNDRLDLIVSGHYADSNTEISSCACVHQAHAQAVRGKPKPDDRIEIIDHRGDTVAVADIPKCRVPRKGRAWETHGHTHKIRLPRGSAT